MKNDRISRNFTYSEFERSDAAALHGTDNTIPDGHIRWAIRLLVVNVLQPLRNAMGCPLHINSGYRSQALNTALKGAANSQHMKGEAADIAAEDPLLLAQTVKRNSLPFDQMRYCTPLLSISHTRHTGHREDRSFITALLKTNIRGQHYDQRKH